MLVGRCVGWMLGLSVGRRETAPEDIMWLPWTQLVGIVLVLGELLSNAKRIGINCQTEGRVEGIQE